MNIENIEKAYDLKNQLSQIEKIVGYDSFLTVDNNIEQFYTILNHRFRDGSSFNFSKETSKRIDDFFRDLLKEVQLKKEKELNDLL